MIYAISRQRDREVLLEFSNWAERDDYMDHGGDAYVITEEWARQWVLDGKEHETGLPGIDDVPPSDACIPIVALADVPDPAPLDWVKIAKAAGQHGIRYPTNASMEAFLAAVLA